MSDRYAAKTEVPADKSRAEIERTLQRYGADQFMYGWDGQIALVGFRLAGRMIRLRVALPQPSEFTLDGRGARRSPTSRQAAYEQAVRQRWRALALIIKAKLEAVAAGITTVEAEFLAATLLPDGRTAGEWLEPQIAHAYQTGAMPHALPGLSTPPPRLLSEGAEE